MLIQKQRKFFFKIKKSYGYPVTRFLFGCAASYPSSSNLSLLSNIIAIIGN
jgi:hypothetical protein